MTLQTSVRETYEKDHSAHWAESVMRRRTQPADVRRCAVDVAMTSSQRRGHVIVTVDCSAAGIVTVSWIAATKWSVIRVGKSDNPVSVNRHPHCEEMYMTF